MIPMPSKPKLFPYTTLFRSVVDVFGNLLEGNQRRGRVDGDARLETERLNRMHRPVEVRQRLHMHRDRKSTRLNSSHVSISYAVFCLKKKNLTEDDFDFLTSN